MNKKLINFIKTEENLTLETKITLFNPHVVQTDLIERNASRESIQIIRTENYTITRCIIKIMLRNNAFKVNGPRGSKWTENADLSGIEDSKWTVKKGETQRSLKQN